MTCECYKIGGPFIAEDPDCPVHGVDGYEGRLEMADTEIGRLRNELQEARNTCREAYELAEHYRAGILNAKLRINSTPMPILQAGEAGSRYAKAMSDAAQILQDAHDEAAMGGPKGYLWAGYSVGRAALKGGDDAS